MCGTVFNNPTPVDIFANFITGALYATIAINFMWLTLNCWNARSLHCILCMVACSAIYQLMLGIIEHDRLFIIEQQRLILQLQHTLALRVKCLKSHLFLDLLGLAL
jgi:hypothetical protein